MIEFARSRKTEASATSKQFISPSRSLLRKSNVAIKKPWACALRPSNHFEATTLPLNLIQRYCTILGVRRGQIQELAPSLIQEWAEEPLLEPAHPVWVKKDLQHLVPLFESQP